MNDYLGGSLVIMAIIGLLCLSVYASVDRQAWLDAHCEIIGNVSGSAGVGTTVSSGGNVGVGTIYIPGKTGYKCDDGMEYWE